MFGRTIGYWLNYRFSFCLRTPDNKPMREHYFKITTYRVAMSYSVGNEWRHRGGLLKTYKMSTTLKLSLPVNRKFKLMTNVIFILKVWCGWSYILFHTYRLSLPYYVFVTYRQSCYWLLSFKFKYRLTSVGLLQGFLRHK